MPLGKAQSTARQGNECRLSAAVRCGGMYPAEFCNGATNPALTIFIAGLVAVRGVGRACIWPPVPPAAPAPLSAGAVRCVQTAAGRSEWVGCVGMLWKGVWLAATVPHAHACGAPGHTGAVRAVPRM
eukprot:350124-Chlamydomonas_euryale.AAC.1